MENFIFALILVLILNMETLN